jgi:hypothetical protein
MSTEKFSYKNILIQHHQEERKKKLIELLKQSYGENKIPGLFLFVIEPEEEEEENYYFENSFCVVCGDFTRIGPEIYGKVQPSNLYCEQLDHQIGCSQIVTKNNAKYHLKEYSKQTCIIQLPVFQRLVFQCEFLLLQKQRLNQFTLTQRYSSVARIWQFETLTRRVRDCLNFRDHHLSELQRCCFEYEHSKILLVYPWLKEMVYEYLGHYKVYLEEDDA